MFSKFFFSEVQAAPETLVNTRKFDTALRFANVHLVTEDLKKGQLHLSTRCLLLHKSEADLITARKDHKLWPVMLSNILSDSRTEQNYRPFAKDPCNRIFRLIRENFELQHTYIASALIHPTNEALHSNFSKWLTRTMRSSTLIRNLVTFEHELGILVEKQGGLQHRLRDRKIRENMVTLKGLTKWRSKDIPLECCWSKEVVHVTYNKEMWLIPSVYLIQIHNKVCDILSSLLLIQASSGVCYEANALSTAVELIEELCLLSLTHDNYFDIAKTLEGMVTAETLVTEDDWVNTTLRDSIHKELAECGFLYKGSNLQEILKEASTPLRHELAGLLKVCGHPIIDVEMTAEKAKERATVSVEVNYHAIQMTRNIALQTFVRNYIVKHGKWPPVEIEDGCPPGLLEARRLNRDPHSAYIKRLFGEVKAEDYVYVTLGQVMDLDKLDHYSQYLKDRALSVLKDEAVAFYIDKTMEQLDWKKTRLLLVYLLHTEEELDLGGYLENYMKSGMSMEDVLNYLTIKLVPKEKELKVAARPFGCKTYQDRYRSCLQEENVKHFLDKYSEDQSMTLDNLALIQRMYCFRNLTKIYKGWRVLYINFDVSGWCGNFRHETVEPICHDLLDAVFGTKDFFSKTQRAYEKGFFYLPDIGGVYHWEGQEGGIEGLNQYTWMTTYIPLMQYALRDFGLHFFVMAYGDDYKAALLIPPDQSAVKLEDLKHVVVQTVSDTARLDFGQKMKYFDSYGSEVFISFCKNASVRACEMPQGVRKIQKCYGATNAFLPTLDDYLSSAFSNAHSAARTMPCTYPAYFVALFWGYHHLITHVQWEDALDDEIHCAMMVPSCAGGLPILFLINFHTRAENDHLPTFIDLVKHVGKIKPELGRRLTHAVSFTRLEAGRYEALLRDPYSLPIVKPPLPSGVLRRELIPALRPIIKNAEVRVLLEAAEDDWTDRIIRCMMSSSEIPARVYSSIFSCTPKALIEEIVKRFETSASIKEILVRRRGPRVTIRILRRVLNAEIALQKWRYERFHLPETEVGLWWNEIPCPTQQADSLRALWGKQVTGVTMPPLTHLLTIVDPSMAAHDEYSRKHHFTYQTFTPEKVVKRSDAAHWHLGEEKPFLGHKTKLGSEVPQVKILDTNPFLSKIKTLLDIVSWVSIGKVNPDGELVESNLPDLIRVLITQYYKGDPKELIPFASQRKSGTIQHHWRSPHYSEHIMPNTLYNTYTWIRGDSNTHQILRGTTDHYTLNFLQVYCHVLHCIQLNLEVSSEILGPGVYWAITTACTYCMRPIDEEPVRVDQSMIPAPRPQVLEGLEITSLSRSLLHEAAQMVLKKAPRNIVEGEVRVDFAVCGVVQTLADQSYTKAKRVCDRLDAPMRVSEDVDMMADWVPGGWQALVREREIRHCPIGLLSEAVLLTIFHMSFQLGSKAMMRSQLIRVWHRNPRELPWTPMIEAIRKAGRLCDVLITVANISGRHPPMCYDNALSASRHLGEIALTQGLLGYLPLKFAWLTYYEEEMVSESMKIFARHAQYVAIWAKIRPLLLTAMRSKVRDAEAEKIMVVAMYLIAAADVADAETIENLIGNSKDGVAVVQVILTDLTDDAVYDNEVESPGSMVNELASSLNDVGAPPGKGQHPPDYEYLLDYDEEANAFIAAEALGHITLSVTQTSLADCINRVRALPDERPIEYTHGSGTAVQGGEIAVADRRPEIKIGFYTAGEDLPTTDITKAHAIVNIFPTKEVILSGHALARPYGHATLSLNKILEIFSHLKLDTTTLSGKNVMCLAEGYGGIMDCLARLSRGSHFVYNTLPPSLQAYVTPAIAIETLRARGHSWDEELVNTSVFDLTLKSTVKALEKNDDRLYHLITCDAEADWSNREKYHALLLNVTHLYLRKRSPKGILILKVMLEHNRSICAVLSLLAHYSERVGCFRLTSSPPGGECYIVARGARRQYAEPITPPDMVLSPKITRLVSTMTKALQRHWEALIPPLDYSLTIQLPAHIDYLRKMKDLLPPAAIHRLISRHQLPITLKDEDYASKRSLTKGVLRELKVVRTALDKEYLAHEGSAAGVVHLALRRILVESCRLHLDAVLVRNIHVYSHSDLRSAFLAFLETMTDRIVFPDPPEIFHETIEIYGVTCDPFPSWLEGIETAMCLWTYNRL